MQDWDSDLLGFGITAHERQTISVRRKKTGLSPGQQITVTRYQATKAGRAPMFVLAAKRA